MIVLLSLLLALLTIGYTKENPFEYRVNSQKSYKEVKQSLLKVIREEGFDPKLITISERRPKMELIYFCPDRVPGRFHKVIAFLPCRIYILEDKRGTVMGTFKDETTLSVFGRYLDPETKDFIKKLGSKIRSILREVAE